MAPHPRLKSFGSLPPHNLTAGQLEAFRAVCDTIIPSIGPESDSTPSVGGGSPGGMRVNGGALGSWEEWLDDDRKVEVKKFYEQSDRDGDLPVRVSGSRHFISTLQRVHTAVHAFPLGSLIRVREWFSLRLLVPLSRLSPIPFLPQYVLLPNSRLPPPSSRPHSS